MGGWVGGWAGGRGRQDKGVVGSSSGAGSRHMQAQAGREQGLTGCAGSGGRSARCHSKQAERQGGHMARHGECSLDRTRVHTQVTGVMSVGLTERERGSVCVKSWSARGAFEESEEWEID